MKVYIWQTTPKSLWYIYWDYGDPISRELSGTTHNLFSRTELRHETASKTARFRMDPQTGLGTIFSDMSYYQFLLLPDTRQGNKTQCRLISSGKWLIHNPKLDCPILA